MLGTSQQQAAPAIVGAGKLIRVTLLGEVGLEVAAVVVGAVVEKVYTLLDTAGREVGTLVCPRDRKSVV